MKTDLNNAMEYRASMADFVKKLAKLGALDDVKRIMDARIDNIAREMTTILDKSATDFLRGQLAICYELADGINEALEANKSKANAHGADRSLTVPEVEL